MNKNIKFNPNKYSRKIPYFYAKTNKVCIFDAKDNNIKIAYIPPLKALTVSEIKRKIHENIFFEQISENDFDALLSEVYSSISTAAIVEDVQDVDLTDLIHNLPKSADLLESGNDAPVIRIINAFLTQAIKENASDIHLDAYEKISKVRFREDGVLHDIVELKPGLHAALVSRIKIMAQLDIAEKRLPQDGRIALRLAGREIDLRVSTIPTGHGERVVMRLLDKNRERLKLEYLGMDNKTLEDVNGLINMPHGIFLVTGPTGSGKSTTLYAALMCLDTSTLNIMTVEDPIEYDIQGISQTQVNAKIDMNFARALRAILRQDPDVVMIGEIRDLETSEIAVQASLTGHLVLATLHTNNASSAITRLVDMGVENFLLSSTLIGVLAQRLIRLLCNNCKKENMSVTKEMRKNLGIKDDITIYSASGCNFCNDTGYKGRIGIYELLIVDSEIQKMIHSNTVETEIEQYAIKKKGMRTLRMDGLRYVIKGETSVEELLFVT